MTRRDGQVWNHCDHRWTRYYDDDRSSRKEWGFLLWAGLSDQGEGREVLVAPDHDYPGGGNFGPDRDSSGTLIQNADPDIFDLIGSVREVQEGDLATYAEGSSALIDESWIWVRFDGRGVPMRVRTASGATR